MYFFRRAFFFIIFLGELEVLWGLVCSFVFVCGWIGTEGFGCSLLEELSVILELFSQLCLLWLCKAAHLLNYYTIYKFNFTFLLTCAIQLCLNNIIPSNIFMKQLPLHYCIFCMKKIFVWMICYLNFLLLNLCTYGCLSFDSVLIIEIAMFCVFFSTVIFWQ